MIINSSLNSLLRAAPPIRHEWHQKLIAWLKVIRGNDFPPVFRAQLEMIECLTNAEQEIHALREQRGRSKQLIPAFKNQGELGRVIQTQREISEIGQTISSLQYYRDCILFLGDVMAIELVDQDTVKHMAAHPPSGFVSGKSGLKAEIAAAKRFFADGYMVLFNDLTHSLRIGDLTLRKGEEVRTFEVKSSSREYFTEEAIRQITTPIIIHEYIKNDVSPVPVMLSGKALAESGLSASDNKPGVSIRLDSNIIEDVQFSLIGKSFKQVYRDSVLQIGAGAKRYFACWSRNIPSLRAAVEEITAQGEWIVSNIRRRVEEHGDLPPFGFWFKPQSAVEIITGEIVLLAAFSMQDLADQLKAKKITLSWQRRDKDLFPMDFKPEYALPDDFEIQTKNICQWHWLRVLYSCLALETYAERCAETLSPETLERFAAKVRSIEKRKELQSTNPKLRENTEADK